MRNEGSNNTDRAFEHGVGNFNVSQAQANSIVQDIVEGNIGHLAQDVVSVGMSNISEDRLASMGLDTDQFDANMTRRGRTLYGNYGSGQTMQNDEMLDPDFNRYNDANYEDVDPNMDTYAAQQTSEQMQQSMEDVKNGKIPLFSRIIMILILLVLIFAGWKIAKVMFSSFRSNVLNIRKSNVISETVDTLRGGQTDTKNEMEGYIDDIINATPGDADSEEDIEAVEEPTIVVDENTEADRDAKVNNSSTEQQEQVSNDPGSLLDKQYTSPEAPYILSALNGLRYKDGVYEPTFDVSNYFLNDKEHILEVGGMEKIYGTFLKSTYYMSDGDTLIIKSPDETYWRCNARGFEDKQKLKDCGTVSIYYYYSKILQEIICVEYVDILNSYNMDELTDSSDQEEVKMVAENQIRKSIEDSLKEQEQ